MARLINLDDEVIVLWAEETKARSFTEENDGEDFSRQAVQFFNGKMHEDEIYPTKKEMLQEKLQEERIDDLKAEYEQEQETIEDEDDE